MNSKNSNLTERLTIKVMVAINDSADGGVDNDDVDDNGDNDDNDEYNIDNEFVSWCFKPSQPQRIISGLKETFRKRYIVERTNKAETRPEEQSEKAESRRENLCNET